MDSFIQLQDTLSSRDVHLKFLISPSRTGSTMLAASLSRSPSVSAYSHEPFVRLGYYGEEADSGYRSILDAISGNTEADGSSVVVKDMSHWIGGQHEYKRLFTLTDAPVLFLTRNPVLSVESRLRKVIQNLNAKYRPPINENCGQRFSHKISTSANNLTELFTEQTKFLDSYASGFGEADWQSLVSASMRSHDYTKFGHILSIPEIFPLSSSGEAALYEEVEYMTKNCRPYVIVDSTEYRLAPEILAPKLCDSWKISNDESMIDWEGSGKKLQTGQNEAHHRFWYDTFLESTRVLPPFEKPLQPCKFPAAVRDHLLRVDLPAYYRLFSNPNRLRSDENVLKREFEVEGRRVNIQDTDPIFSLLSDPSLVKDSRFMENNRLLFDQLDGVDLIRHPEGEVTLPRRARK